MHRPLKLKDLRRILRSYGIQEDTGKGKGSHTMFYKTDGKGKTIASYPVPTTRSDVLVCYISGCRKRFRLKLATFDSDMRECQVGLTVA